MDSQYVFVPSKCLKPPSYFPPIFSVNYLMMYKQTLRNVKSNPIFIGLLWESFYRLKSSFKMWVITQYSRLESPEINPNMYQNSVHAKGGIKIHEEENVE